MNLPFTNPFQSIKSNVRPVIFLGIIIISALFFFEMFNYSTTEYALHDLLGELKFMGIQWATLLSVAFCGIDFAGIARLFTPDREEHEHKEIWYLFGAWLLAATMNATLTWWGVSMAIANHVEQSSAVVAPKTIQTVVPVFVALMVWVIRILIIGMISAAGDRFIWGKTSHRPNRPAITHSSIPSGHTAPTMSNPRPVSASYSRPTTSLYAAPRETRTRPEPTYHSLSVSESDSSDGTSSARKF